MHLLGDDIPGISIHAAREGGDGKALFYYDEDLISIHAAREGGDRIVAVK